MLVELLRRWYNIDPSMGECFLVAGSSATGTKKAAFLQLFYFTASRYLSLYVMTNNEIK